MRQVAAFSDLSFASRLSQGSFWSQHCFCFYFSAAVCGKVIGSPVYVCLYANTHNVFPPPQPAGSCVDSGWLKCRSKRRQPSNQPFPSPLSAPPYQTPPSPSLTSLQPSPKGFPSFACVIALSSFPKSPFQSSCQKAHSSKPLPRLNASVATVRSVQQLEVAKTVHYMLPHIYLQRMFCAVFSLLLLGFILIFVFTKKLGDTSSEACVYNTFWGFVLYIIMHLQCFIFNSKQSLIFEKRQYHYDINVYNEQWP